MRNVTWAFTNMELNIFNLVLHDRALALSFCMREVTDPRDWLRRPDWQATEGRHPFRSNRRTRWKGRAARRSDCYSTQEALFIVYLLKIRQCTALAGYTHTCRTERTNILRAQSCFLAGRRSEHIHDNPSISYYRSASSDDPDADLWWSGIICSTGSFFWHRDVSLARREGPMPFTHKIKRTV